MMATCKDCLHEEACGGYLPTDTDKDVWDLCAQGKSDEIADIENRCGSFKDKSKYVEQKHGQWKVVDSDGSWRVDICSLCGKRMHYVDYALPDNYCPNCGAKMEE